MDGQPNFRENFSWITYGNGPKVFLAFHGYGQKKEVFKNLVVGHENQITLYSFDLPAHGDNGGYELTEEDFSTTLERFLEEHKIKRFSMISFSIGSRISHFAMSRYENHIEQVVLIAPDGIIENFWYNFATNSMLGKSLFRHMTNKPGIYLSLIKRFKSMRWVSSNTYRLARNQIVDQNKRQQLYFTWISVRNLILPGHSPIEWFITHQKPVLIFLGTQDQIIPTEKVKRKLKPVVSKMIVELNCNHERLFHESIKTLKENFSTLLLKRQ